MFNSRDGIAGRRGDATATAITHAAAHLVARHQDPSVAAVAQATGVARGTIYRYFPTRQALLTAVLDQALHRADHHLTQANLAAVPVMDGLGRAVRALVALGDDFLVLAGAASPAAAHRTGHAGVLPCGRAAGPRTPSGRASQRSALVLPGGGTVCAGPGLPARQRAGRCRTRRHQRDRAATLPGRLQATTNPRFAVNRWQDARTSAALILLSPMWGAPAPSPPYPSCRPRRCPSWAMGSCRHGRELDARALPVAWAVEIGWILIGGAAGTGAGRWWRRRWP